MVLGNDLAELGRLAAWIQAWANRAALQDDTSFAVQLCLEEAVANIIMHGAAPDQRLEIAVELHQDDRMLTVEIEDGGLPFDPTRVPAPSIASSLEDARVGELGVHLIRSFATDMHYERRDRSNQLTLRFARGEREPGRPT
jgi:serine/threonine-protein kinase RsbW/sigma-B regulation protein RsbU (phosphoserine phosphatase)